jgi:hypothetical protein
MAYRIVLRQDTATNWQENNPTLLSGEFGFETDTNKLKLGNGTSPWNSLSYYLPGPTGPTGPTGAFVSPFVGNVNIVSGQAWVSSTIATTTIDWNNGNVQTHTLSANTTFTFANPQNGATYILVLRQGSSGGYSVTWPTISWASSSVPVVTSTANKYDIYTFVYANNKYFGTYSQNFS